MNDTRTQRNYGLGRGKVFPAAEAKSLLNPLRRLVQSPARTVAAMRLRSTDRVLEVGCGPGFFTPSIAAMVAEGAVVAFDLQREMLVHARERLTDSLEGDIRLVQGDASMLPFVNGSFDAVLIAVVLGEVPNADTCLAEVRRVLRIGGIAAIAETRRDSDFITLPELRSRSQAHGLEFVGRSGFRWQYVARFKAV